MENVRVFLFVLLLNTISKADQPKTWSDSIFADTLEYFFEKEMVDSEFEKMVMKNEMLDIKGMANPNQEFNPSCIGKPGVPYTRFIMFAKSKNSKLLVFEHGGRASGITCWIFKSDTLFKSIPLSTRANNEKELKKEIEFAATGVKNPLK